MLDTSIIGVLFSTYNTYLDAFVGLPWGTSQKGVQRTHTREYTFFKAPAHFRRWPRQGRVLIGPARFRSKPRRGRRKRWNSRLRSPFANTQGSCSLAICKKFKPHVLAFSLWHQPPKSLERTCRARWGRWNGPFVTAAG